RGEQVREANGRPLTVTSIRVYSEDGTAYNLTIAGTHTYYAGATPVLVHNSCGSAADEGSGAAQPAAERYAAELRAAGDRPPTAASAAVHRTTGATYLGHSGELKSAPESLAGRFPD